MGDGASKRTLDVLIGLPLPMMVLQYLEARCLPPSVAVERVKNEEGKKSHSVPQVCLPGLTMEKDGNRSSGQETWCPGGLGQ